MHPKPEQSEWLRLYRMADVADRAYAVQSRLPLVAPLVVRLRNSLTWHVREPYFDVMVERQVEFNRVLVDVLSILRQCQANRSRFGALVVAQPQPHACHASCDIAGEAARLAAKLDVTAGPVAARWLAGPLPEYGDALGAAFYKRLYDLCLTSQFPGADPLRARRNMRLAKALRALATRIEVYAEQSQVIQQFTSQRAILIDRTVAELGALADVMLRGYTPLVPRPALAPLKIRFRQEVTSHAREARIDPTFERQVAFNLRVVACLQQLGRIGQGFGDGANLYATLHHEAAIVTSAYRVRSRIPIVGGLIARTRRALTSHLMEPYVEPLFQRQAAFNCAVAEHLVSLHQFAMSLPGQAPGSRYENYAEAGDIRKDLAALTELLPEPGALWLSPPEEQAFFESAHTLTREMSICFECLVSHIDDADRANGREDTP